MARAVTGARATAWRLHQQVWAEGAYANITWPRLLREAKLSSQDISFATELAYGSMRRFGQWSAIIERASGRERSRIEPEVWWLLVLGTHQLLAMATPVHAAVNEMVALSKSLGFGRASGLVNAVLRRISERSLPQWLEVLTEGVSNTDEALGLRTAHPSWVVAALRNALEREGAQAQLEELLDSHNIPAQTHLTLLEGSPGIHDARTRFSPRGVVAAGKPGDDPRVVSGVARVQDEGSQLAALVAAAARPLSAHAGVVDACAGPGGKTALLASRINEPVVAVEQHPHRAQLVRDSVRALPAGQVNVVTADVVDYLRDAGYQDLVLLDAPCSGLGALRRRPEARWTKQVADLDTLVALQRRLLGACLSSLAPGGVVVYVTCSPVPAETSEQVGWALDTYPQIEAVDTEPVLAGVAREPVPHCAVGSAVQLWPHRHGTDAMFIQILRRRDDP